MPRWWRRDVVSNLFSQSLALATVGHYLALPAAPLDPSPHHQHEGNVNFSNLLKAALTYREMKAGHCFRLIPVIKSIPLCVIPGFINDNVFPWCVFHRRLWLRRVGLGRGGLWTGPLPLVRRLVGRGRRGRPLCVRLHLPKRAQHSGTAALKKKKKALKTKLMQFVSKTFLLRVVTLNT